MHSCPSYFMTDTQTHAQTHTLHKRVMQNFIMCFTGNDDEVTQPLHVQYRVRVVCVCVSTYSEDFALSVAFGDVLVASGTRAVSFLGTYQRSSLSTPTVYEE